MLSGLRQGLADLGSGATAKLSRLGFAARFFVAILLHSGTAFRRFGLTIREIYFAGVLSMVIILVSGLFVGMVLGLQGFETLQRQHHADEQAGHQDDDHRQHAGEVDFADREPEAPERGARMQ